MRLVTACSSGNEELALLLLAKGADVTRPSSGAYTDGLTALDICAAGNLTKAAAAMAAAGGSASAVAGTRGRRQTACRLLLWACRDSCDAAALRLLREDLADVACSDDAGLTPMHWAVNSGSEEVITALYERGADPLAKDGRGNTPLDMTVAIEDAGVRGRVGPLLARMRADAGKKEDL